MGIESLVLESECDEISRGQEGPIFQMEMPLTERKMAEEKSKPVAGKIESSR